MRVLVVEDDKDIAANLFDYLESESYEIDLASDGLTALHLAVTQPCDAILLDVSLPGMDGLSFCRKLRTEARCDTPVLMLTARDTLEDKLRGFEHGADDYLVKPFSLKEVGARLSALIKRYKGQVTPAILQCGDVRLDPGTLQVERAGRLVKLPPKCMLLLQMLMRSPNRVLRRAELETEVWGEQLPDSDTLRAHIHTLRRALTAAGESEPIETVHGFGYKFTSGDA
jgi:DNA-binding response OmpR family regulator